MTYAVVPGVFKKLCWAARRDPEQPYVLVIDEINRAPLAQVFGELLYALEYRGPHGTVQLSSPISGLNEQLYSETETGSGFYVPDNMFIIGTMNTADRSLAGMDYALRRRFRFIEMQPDAGVLERWLRQQGAPEATEAQRKIMLALFSQVNARLAELLDPDHRLGHSYFMRDPLNADMLDRLWRTSVKPLLSEYFIPPMGEIDDFAQMFRAAGEKMRDA